MTDRYLFRIGGVSAVLGVLVMMAGSSLHALLWIGALLLALFYFVNYRFLGTQPSSLNLVAAWAERFL
jgi:hypothetical protein